MQQLIDLQRDKDRDARPRHSQAMQAPGQRPTDPSKGLPRPDPFDGSKPWKPFYSQFSRRARIMGLNQEASLDHLVLCLQGPALTFYESLADGVRNSFPNTVSALQKRFFEALSLTGHRLRFQSLEQNEKETVLEFADRIQQVALKAYPFPDIPEDFRQSEMVTCFLLGTSCQKASMHSVHKNFATLDEAVNFVQAFNEHQHALTPWKAADDYSSWDPSEDDPEEIWRSQLHQASGQTESQALQLQAQIEVLNKRVDQLAMLLEKQAIRGDSPQAQDHPQL
jgi:hypothetical protein